MVKKGATSKTRAISSNKIAEPALADVEESQDPPSAQEFLGKHADELAPSVVREVKNKLQTGLKNPRIK